MGRSARHRAFGDVVPVLGLCALVALSRLPFLAAPVSPDEGGFLVVGSQWRAGSSLYGSYWVDRPPLLIAAFAAADTLGGAVALRVLGLVAAVAAVGLAGVVGHVVSGRRTAVVACAVTAATFLATPLFGTRVVDGELLASPLVLGGVAALLASYRCSAGRAAALRATAGAAGAAALLVKQSMLEVVVLTVVLAGHALRRHGVRAAAVLLAPVVAGAAATAVAVALLAVARGTPLPGLWGAVVTFRFAADRLLGLSSGARLAGLLHAYVVSGALAVTVVAAGVAARTGVPRGAARPPLRTAAAAVVTAEAVAAFAGGSYWSHYLVGLVPGLVLVVAVAERASRRWPRRLLALALAYAAVAGTVAWAADPAVPTLPTDDQSAAAYVRGHARPGDTVVVAFGHADIVDESGLPSPYPYLWALPAFVRDPRLTALDRLLRSGSAPQWVVAGGDLRQWGPPGAAVQRTLDRRYAVATRTDRWIVLHREAGARGRPRSVTLAR